MMKKNFDYIVIGAGSGGVRFARLMAKTGKKVCLIEKSKVGGTCVIRGCVPKKLYVYASAFEDQIQDAKTFGWNINLLPKHNWKNLVNKKNNEIDRLNKIYINNLTKAGVVLFQDEATLLTKNSVLLKKKKTKITGKNIIIATGSSPNIPNINGANLGITSDQFFELKKLPKNISIVGSGYIAIEFAFLLKNLGYDVNLIIRKKTILNEFDEDIGSRILEAAKAKKIKLFDESYLLSLTKNKNFIYVKTNKGTIKTNLVIYAIGRSPNLSSLQLEKIGVKTNSHKAIKVNSKSQTTIPNIYALGDVTNRKNLTPVAIREAVYLYDYFTTKKVKTLNYKNVASAIFTQPEVGVIGYSEKDLIQLNKKYKILKTEFTPMKYAFYKKKKNKVFIKVIYEPKSEKVLGAIYIGEGAAEIIQTLAIAITKKLTLKDLKLTVPVHPTSSEELVTLV